MGKQEALAAPRIATLIYEGAGTLALSVQTYHKSSLVAPFHHTDPLIHAGDLKQTERGQGSMGQEDTYLYRGGGGSKLQAICFSLESTDMDTGTNPD